MSSLNHSQHNLEQSQLSQVSLSSLTQRNKQG